MAAAALITAFVLLLALPFVIVEVKWARRRRKEPWNRLGTHEYFQLRAEQIRYDKEHQPHE